MYYIWTGKRALLHHDVLIRGWEASLDFIKLRSLKNKIKRSCYFFPELLILTKVGLL